MKLNDKKNFQMKIRPNTETVPGSSEQHRVAFRKCLECWTVAGREQSSADAGDKQLAGRGPVHFLGWSLTRMSARGY